MRVELGSTGGSAVGSVTAQVPWSVPEFVDQAVVAEHPMDSTHSLLPALYSNIFKVLTRSKDATIRFRKSQLAKFLFFKKQLQPKENILHANMNVDVERVMASKHILLFQRMCREVGIEDRGLTSRMTGGFKITGSLDSSGLFPSEPLPQT